MKVKNSTVRYYKASLYEWGEAKMIWHYYRRIPGNYLWYRWYRWDKGGHKWVFTYKPRTWKSGDSPDWMVLACPVVDTLVEITEADMMLEIL